MMSPSHLILDSPSRPNLRSGIRQSVHIASGYLPLPSGSSRTFPIRGQESRKCRETPMFFGKVCTMGLDLGACDFRWWLRWEL